jgi:hypothetical protein
MNGHSKSCAFCGSAIVPGERWVRERMRKPALDWQDPTFQYYHIALSASDESSCWEKHQLERFASKSRM